MGTDLPDPWRSLAELLQQAPDDVRSQLAAYLSDHLSVWGSGTAKLLFVAEVKGYASVAAKAQTAEASGTAYPATVRAEGSTVEVTPGELTVTQSDAAPSQPINDLVLAALVIVVVCLTWISVGTEPFPKSLVPLLEVAIGFLLWPYDHLSNRR
jgi:hypothetical protein